MKGEPLFAETGWFDFRAKLQYTIKGEGPPRGLNTKAVANQGGSK